MPRVIDCGHPCDDLWQSYR